jgi:hypothetical protein
MITINKANAIPKLNIPNSSLPKDLAKKIKTTNWIIFEIISEPVRYRKFDVILLAVFILIFSK